MIAEMIEVVASVQIAEKDAFLIETRFAHRSIWSDPSGAVGQSWEVQQLFIHRNRITPESCRTTICTTQRNT